MPLLSITVDGPTGLAGIGLGVGAGVGLTSTLVTYRFNSGDPGISGSSGGAGRSGSSIGKSGTWGILSAASSSIVDIFGAPSGSFASIAAGKLVAWVKSALIFLIGITSSFTRLLAGFDF